MAIAGTRLEIRDTEGVDKITQVEKVTSPYHSDGASTLGSGNIISSSLTDTNEKYFFGISHTNTPSTVEWNVAFGSTNGYGSLVEPNTKAETNAVYKQYASLLLASNEVTGGFIISSPGTDSAVASGRDDEIYVVSARRSNMKDRLNKGSWTLVFSGSLTDGTTYKKLSLTDDSVEDNPTSTPVGDRYNIISGAAGTLHNSTVSSSTAKTYGHFYPDMGIMVFSAAELSASIPGKGGSGGVDRNAVVNFDSASQRGFGFTTNTDANYKTPLRLINSLTQKGSMTFRDEEDQVSAQYFCRVHSGQANFSNNNTFVSGGLNELRHTKMKGNPVTFITSVQLYNAAGEMVAVGNLSTPLKKSFSSEATIKVKLTY